MDNENDVYEKIAAMWRLPGSRRLIRILKNGFTPEEGEIILGLSTFTTCEQLAEKLNKDKGMLHIPPNRAIAQMFCNCCACCCEIIYPYNHYGDPVTNAANLSPSSFRAVINQETCSGCQTCVERCPFNAIEIQSVPGSRKMKAFIIDEHCMGCGLCVIKCPNNSLTLELVRPPEHIPTATTDELEDQRLSLPDWLGAPA